jgi:hypothetical protein
MVNEPARMYNVVYIDKLTFKEQVNWCYSQFGVPGNRWFSINNKIFFRDEADYSWYLMMYD